MKYCPLGLVYDTVFALTTAAYQLDSLCTDLGRHHVSSHRAPELVSLRRAAGKVSGRFTCHRDRLETAEHFVDKEVFFCQSCRVNCIARYRCCRSKMPCK